MEFFFTFFLVRNLLKRDALQRYTFSRSNALVAATFILLFLVIAASVIRISRGAKENYRGTSRFLTEAQGSMIISPSVYLYVSSDVGVLSKYLDLEKEHVRFGENSFRIVYESLSRLRAVEEPTFYQKMYAIPMWTNTGTYIRELHADFGVAGVFLFPYLLGLATTFFWFKFYENHNLIVLTMLVYLFIIVGFTFLMMITRLNIWFFGQILIIAYLPIMKRIAIRVHH
jgi:oligosaccharide repeat unit polymerase